MDQLHKKLLLHLKDTKSTIFNLTKTNDIQIVLASDTTINKDGTGQSADADVNAQY